MLPLRKARLRLLTGSADVPVFEEWLKEQPYVAVDTETTGLKWWLPEFRVRLVQVGNADVAWIIRPDRFGFLVEQLLTEYTGLIVGHNFAGFDVHALREAGFTVPPLWKVRDTLMMSRILDSRGFHGLKPLAGRELGPDAIAAAGALDVAFKKLGYGSDKGRGFTEISYDVLAYTVYSGADVILTARLYELWWSLIVQDYLPAYEREMGAWRVTYEHEAKGLPADLEYTHGLAAEYEHRLHNLTFELQELGIANPNSKAQRLQVLYGEGFEADEFTESGEPKLDKAALEKFASPTALKLIEHGRISGWLEKYIYKVRDENYRGYIFPSFNPFGARTGRQSASNPPLQQLPGKHEEAHKIRRMILPRPGEEIWSIDYDAQENRLLAHFSKDEALLKIINENLDIHIYTAAQIYGVAYEDVTYEQRQTAKTYKYACLTPEHRVLTKDLQWIPAGDLKVGDALLGFDEHHQAPVGSHARLRQRRWRQNAVVSTGRAMMHTFRITLVDGTVFTASDEHPWLMSSYRSGSRQKSAWTTTQNLSVGDSLLRATDTWERATDFAAGWLSGMFDGEGYANFSPGKLALGVAQVPTGVAGVQLEKLLAVHGVFHRYKSESSSAAQWVQAGRTRDSLRTLGILGPVRLLANMWKTINGRTFETQRVQIVAIEDAGVREVVTLGTATRTYLAEGFATHNSTYGAGPKKLAKNLEMPIDEVKAMARTIDAAFAGVTAWKRQIEDEGKYRFNTEGAAYAFTWGGRRVYADQYEGFPPKYYTLTNYILQGTGADVLKEALNRIAAAGLSRYILLPVHDEILFSLPTGPEGKDRANELARIMTFEDEFIVPLTCSPEGPFPAWSPH